MVQQQLGESTTLDSMQLMTNEPDEVRILLLGDASVGKTSLIYSLVNDDFDPNLPSRMANISIPAEITPENVPLFVVDYSKKEQNYDELREEIVNSNVICIVYDASDEQGLDRVTNYWIPEIHKCQSNSNDYKPLIVVANKIDLIDQDNPTLDRISIVLQEFIDIEAYIETSALNQKNVVELFAAAQKAVVYPLAPLFDPQLRILTKKCRNALINVFKVSDLDNDGLLSDYELNLFHENCFGVPLQTGALEDLKSIIKQSIMGGIIDDGITETGFLFIHTLSIDKGRHDFTWQVLKKFNYDRQINRKAKSRTSSSASISSSLSTTKTEADNLASSDEAAQELLSSLEKSISQLDRITSTNSDKNNKSLIELNSMGSLSSRLNNNEDGNEQKDEEECDVFLRSQFNSPWLRDHSGTIKTGLGLTLVTLISMLAVRYLVQSSNRNLS